MKNPFTFVSRLETNGRNTKSFVFDDVAMFSIIIYFAFHLILLHVWAWFEVGNLSQSILTFS